MRMQAVFDNLDKDRNGSLDRGDIKDLLKLNRKRLKARGMSKRKVSRRAF